MFSIVDYIFIYKGPEVTLNLNENEVKSIRYVTKDELQELFAQAGKCLLIRVFDASLNLFIKQ